MKAWFWFRLAKEGQLDDTATRAKLENSAIVDEFREAVKIKYSLELEKVTAKNLRVYANEAAWRSSGCASMEASNKLIDGDQVQLGRDEDSAIIVAVPSTMKEKHMGYRRISADLSCRKFLDAVATRLVSYYDFPRSFGVKGTIGDVFDAVDRSDWKPLDPSFLKSLPDFFGEDEWDFLRRLDRKVNRRIHDGAIPTNSRNRPYIVLLNSEFNSENQERVSKIALKAELVGERVAWL